MSVSIPQPRGLPLIGNIADIDRNAPIQSLMRLARIHGPFFRMTFFDREIYIAGSQALVDELCDESRFQKALHPPLKELRALAGDALFTAYTEEPNWEKAHRLLMPAFGPVGVRGMFDRMLDIAEQMFVRWERFGPDAVIDVADNMTRLTLDTIALCAFDYRFNSFYQNEMHPFVAAMVRALEDSGQRAQRPDLMKNLMVASKHRLAADQAVLEGVARQLVEERRRNPERGSQQDLLGIMLEGADPVTGEKLSDQNIIHQMITFLVAGHETTSGLLSFATHLLLENPGVLQEARRVIGEVLGSETPRVEDLDKLRYIDQILMETLRIWPTAPAFAVTPTATTMIGGQYPLEPGDLVLVLEPILHRDPAVWGTDVEAFRPERFAPDAVAARPANAWKPFGNGKRACIGRAFALQEAKLVLTMMLQRFDLSLVDPGYRLEVVETLTLKPHGLTVRARSRGIVAPHQRSVTPTIPPRPLTQAKPEPAPGATPLLVLFGSNTGTAEAFANRVANEALGYGFAPVLAPLDDYAGKLPDKGALVLVTASYEGQPPDNAGQFVAWVEELGADALGGLRFAVFGCGNRQWSRTYQAVPQRVDAALEKAGAARVIKRGEGDADSDLFGAFDAWLPKLWEDLGAAFGQEPSTEITNNPLTVEVLRNARTEALRLTEMDQATVVENRELVAIDAPGARSKRHIEIALPSGMTYRAGDYLAVLARNPDAQIDRVLRRFGLPADAQLMLERAGANQAGALPLGRPVAAVDLLANYVELGQPATRAQVTALAAATRCPPEKAPLERLAGDEYEAEVLGRRVSVIDLLDRFQSCDLSLAVYLSMLPPLRARQYSISSSPLWREDHLTLTVAVLDQPAQSGIGRFQGVASTYLAELEAGARLSVVVRPSHVAFHPPEDPQTPIILVCAGTGIAPFRGFIQERAIQKAAGQSVGPALLFFGIDHPEVDFLYRDELAQWQKQGVVEVLTAFSAAPEGDIAYVQHRLWQERTRVAELFLQGATVFVCGDGRHMAPAVRETFLRIYRDVTGASEDAAAAWADQMERDHARYVSDVFA
ncbi:bifunctional cytochrome P450/NADPH--P450 reductase [Novosphingobium aquimarinum]|uniref:bifunctional cytochrome P450/NADPH--P450 reductase n=1 Tax=Novosphingobium aquimarinum TaxID=2682494 RepID=UPI0012EBE136|nr:cytochrome P450 [Novosphingobium aquimarinum]